MYTKEQPDTVQRMFSSIANRYDRGNALMSFSLHRLWNRLLVKRVVDGASEGLLLDLCAGTGEIAYTFMQRTKRKGRAILLDFCPEMLQCARDKAVENHFDASALTFIEGDAQVIPLGDNSVDFVTIAYGIRNVQDPEKCLSEAFRVLKPGGRLGILELTRPKSRWLNMGHKIYLKTMLPLVGKLFWSNDGAQAYLRSTIQTFIDPAQLSELMRRAGFGTVAAEPLTGGIATVLTGDKPNRATRIPLRTAAEKLPEGARRSNPMLSRTGIHRLSAPRGRRRRAVI
jgi:demethylmenaquinone methyltransferase/2-methoxy-6-polyprenyl-1,4-benzoquinol methylase